MENVVLKTMTDEECASELVQRVMCKEKVEFVFPDGFNQLPTIEYCRAYNAFDINDEDNFDLMYDIMVQMIVGKKCDIYMLDDKLKKNVYITSFVVIDRYQNLNNIDIIGEYPCLLNWLVERARNELAKKFPHSLKDMQEAVSAKKKEEPAT